MAARIYVIPVSNPSAAGAAMLRQKRVPHRVVTLMPGLHPLLVRAAGFDRHTVPALELDGRKVQGSRAIARALDELVPDRPCCRGTQRNARRSRRPSAGASGCCSRCRVGCSVT
jgi:glutathione S-transferase